MKSDKLDKAREYERINGARITVGERPCFHFSTYIGWMNDPNGFSFYKDSCHLFYQYHPYDNSWGPMHWGHACSKDFIKWDYLPAALAPDTAYDKDGCWSGSAIELEDGRQALIYTGHTSTKNSDNQEIVRQVQCLAIGDGIDYDKYENNPIITSEDLPKCGKASDFRDPKVWYDQEDKLYYLVIGNRSDDSSGMILLYSSEDLRSWKFVCVLDRSNNEYGKMWECPDFFGMDGKQILLISPQEMRPEEPEYHGGYGTVCIIGEFDRKSNIFKRQYTQSIDQGLDFYAPQTTLTPDGRRVMIAWMQAWESCRNQPAGNKFFGMMTIPRELSVRDGRLCQQPVRELEGYRANNVIHNNVEVSDELKLDGISGRIIDMTVDVRMSNYSQEDYFTIRLAMDEENDSQIRYYPATGALSFDRSNSGFNYDIVNRREIFTTQESVKLRILMDRYSIEIFVDDGRYVLTNTLYTPITAEGISFAASSKAVIDVDKWDIII